MKLRALESDFAKVENNDCARNLSRVMNATDDQMSTVEERGSFSLVERRKKKEKKRKAQKVIDSDSEPIKEIDIMPTPVALKKKRKAPRNAQVVESAVEDEERSLISLKEKSRPAFDRMLNLVTEAKLENSLKRKIRATATELKELVNEALIANGRLEDKIECLQTDIMWKTPRGWRKRCKRPSRKPFLPKKPLTYAERVGVKAKNVATASIMKPRNLITILPGKNESLKSSENLKEALKKMVIPREEGIGIRNVRKIKNNGLLIETLKKRNIETIMRNEKIRATGMEVGLPAKRST
ncbi:uncharacterized protein LOC118450511 [Vespa mandarinia]|uniref:uncharacterized protein LOC118450511 n=1 Tax=Vespa mandarinia TaxID=7446 RepID=UPI00161C6238|nr:uncharacterized protein LOC118450511 [Vespa mandarinia]XP_035742206.1 uncharacterized protein LOC118450511 [Vespa mandarinia]XP_035742207.1 uncharacterized protein LOC118450511 [Vespa mandarinia]XP_035742208.1 uncharacterized protein LOC118450511 [Vespa mandarinia]XP_035742209.1 uncharacterized protein LOC118450511 [Vespa mandarinia]